MEVISIIIFGVIVFVIWYFCGGSSSSSSGSSSSKQPETNKLYPDLSSLQKNSVWSLFGGGSSYDAILDKFTSLEDVTNAIRQAGLESCNLIFGKEKYMHT